MFSRLVNNPEETKFREVRGFQELRLILDWSENQLVNAINKLINAENALGNLSIKGALAIIAHENHAYFIEEFILDESLTIPTEEEIDDDSGVDWNPEDLGLDDSVSFREFFESSSDKIKINHCEFIRWEPIKYFNINEIGLEKETINAILSRGYRGKDFPGIYEFQKKAYDNIMAGKDVAITAPTGTGKTLSFLMPIMDKILKEKKQGSICAMIVTPLKALTKDQELQISSFTKKLGIRVESWTGDVSQNEKDRIFGNPPEIILTNFDSIYYNSRNQNRFITFLKKIQILVVDEMHYYEGIHGSNVHHLITSIIRNNPKIQLIGASATIDNLQKFANRLFDRDDVTVISSVQKNTKMKFIMASPPSRNFDETLIRIAKLCQKENKQFLIFRDSITGTEKFAYKAQKRGIKIQNHRAGLTSDERKETESRLRNRDLDGLVCTPTLELGIDIGSIDVVVSASLVPWGNFKQRMGRAGRGNQMGYGILLLGDDPVAEWYKKYPQDYKTETNVFINPKNNRVSKMMIPYYGMNTSKEQNNLINVNEPIYKDPKYQKIFDIPSLFKKDGNYLIPNIWNIQRHIENYSIRGMGFNVNIFEDPYDGYTGPISGRKAIGSYSSPGAFEKLYEGGIYLHSTNPYKIIKTNLNPNDKTKEAEHYVIVQKIKSFKFHIKNKDEKKISIVEKYCNEQNLKYSNKEQAQELFLSNAYLEDMLKNKNILGRASYGIRYQNDVYLIKLDDEIPIDSKLLYFEKSKILHSFGENKEIWCVPTEKGFQPMSPHYTKPQWEKIPHKNDSEMDKRIVGGIDTLYGEIELETRVKGYKKFYLDNDQPYEINKEELEIIKNPETIFFDTKGIVYKFPLHDSDYYEVSKEDNYDKVVYVKNESKLLQEVKKSDENEQHEKYLKLKQTVRDGYHVIEHSIQHAGITVTSTSSENINGVFLKNDEIFEVIIYDNSGEGESGVTEAMFYKNNEILRRALEMIKFCPKKCENKTDSGCPYCTFMIRKCEEWNENLFKPFAINKLEEIVTAIFRDEIKQIEFSDSFDISSKIQIREKLMKYAHLINNVKEEIENLFYRIDKNFEEDYTTYHNKV